MRQITITVDDAEFRRLEEIVATMHDHYGFGFTKTTTAAAVCFRQGLEIQSKFWKLPPLKRFGEDSPGYPKKD